MNAQNNSEKKTQNTSGSTDNTARNKPENRKTDKQAKNCK